MRWLSSNFNPTFGNSPNTRNNLDTFLLCKLSIFIFFTFLGLFTRATTLCLHKSIKYTFTNLLNLQLYALNFSKTNELII